MITWSQSGYRTHDPSIERSTVRLSRLPNNKQVAFHAHFSGNWDTPINVGTHATLKFDAVVTNVGKGYNPDTGAFTAPYNGTYLFLLTAVSKDRYTELDIRASGSLHRAGHQSFCKDRYIELDISFCKDRYIELDIRASGGRLLAMTGGYWDMGESAGTHRDTSHGTVHLAGGEQVWVQHNSHGSTILQYWYTTFTGVLLQADLD
nr:hypothetical protein BaRGS_011417 [Batillaria attramentaria]